MRLDVDEGGQLLDSRQRAGDSMTPKLACIHQRLEQASLIVAASAGPVNGVANPATPPTP